MDFINLLPFGGKSLGETVKNARDKMKMTQAGLARKCGTAQISVARLEADEPIPLKIGRKIAKTLGLDELEFTRALQRCEYKALHKIIVDSHGKKPNRGEPEVFALLMGLSKEARRRIIESVVTHDIVVTLKPKKH